MTRAEKLITIAENEPKVYEAGMKAENVAFWDAVQNYGNRDTYNYAFAYWDKFEYIHPNHKIVPTNASGCYAMFLSNKGIKKIEAEYFDFSQKPRGTSAATSYGYTFNSCSYLEEIEDIGLVPEFDYSSTFGQCSKLHTIAKIRVDENTKFSNTFNGCTVLQNITIDGTIGQNRFNVQWSTKLSADSLKSIIQALSSTTTGLTITLPTTAQANYEAVYGEGSWSTLTATRSNWTIAYA